MKVNNNYAVLEEETMIFQEDDTQAIFEEDTLIFEENNTQDLFKFQESDTSTNSNKSQSEGKVLSISIFNLFRTCANFILLKIILIIMM